MKSRTEIPDNSNLYLIIGDKTYPNIITLFPTTLKLVISQHVMGWVRKVPCHSPAQLMTEMVDIKNKSVIWDTTRIGIEDTFNGSPHC